ncbi:hypothetical protein [Symbiopectobacterium sp. RP]|uniref:hypothetical protein n=1 Tax=Symbiopectobacterium sp. RP TaxID=3248553 RepID=UPI003D2A4D31
MGSSKFLYDFTSTRTINLYDIQGNKVTFTLPSNNNEDGMVIVTVSNGKHEVKGEITSDKFKCALAEMVMFQRENVLSTIMEDNEDKTCFTLDQYYIDDDFEDHFRICNARYGSVDSAIYKDLNFLDIEDVNSIIQEGGIFSASSK